ncbi:hypothetical protein AB5N19_10705 [Seiridium cardinale]|uniref:Uncharacterized protein n=1 Tax=Seiridium cardinale TaxID=138064 RepID=A0ABR2XSN1_9PEZI
MHSPHLLGLPLELRLAILEYTDLVLPLNKVKWNQRTGYSGFSNFALFCGRDCGPPYDQCHPNLHQDCLVSFDYRNGSKGCKGGCPHKLSSPLHVKCWNCKHYACQFRHIWQPPTPLFLICRQFANDARRVFFSVNHFHIKDDTAFLDNFPGIEPTYPVHTQYAANTFLSARMSDHSLKHIQSISFDFAFIYGREGDDDAKKAMYKDWLGTFEKAKTAMSLQLLVLESYWAGAISLKDWAAMDQETLFDKARSVVNEMAGPVDDMSCAKIIVANLDQHFTDLSYCLRPFGSRVPAFKRIDSAEMQATRAVPKGHNILDLGEKGRLEEVPMVEELFVRHNEEPNY